MPRDHILVRVVGCTNPKEAWHFAAAALAFRVRGEIEFISTTHTQATGGLCSGVGWRAALSMVSSPRRLRALKSPCSGASRSAENAIRTRTVNRRRA